MAVRNSTRNTSSTNSVSDAWKADAFINVSLPTKSGSSKLGALTLKMSKEQQAAIIEYCKKDEGNITKLMAGATYTFNLAAADEQKGYVLPD